MYTSLLKASAGSSAKYFHRLQLFDPWPNLLIIQKQATVKYKALHLSPFKTHTYFVRLNSRKKKPPGSTKITLCNLQAVTQQRIDAQTLSRTAESNPLNNILHRLNVHGRLPLNETDAATLFSRFSVSNSPSNHLLLTLQYLSTHKKGFAFALGHQKILRPLHQPSPSFVNHQL